MTSLQKAVEMMTIELPVDDSASDETEERIGPHKIVFTGRLLADSEGYSLAQVPRIFVYETQGGKIIVYRTPEYPVVKKGPTYRAYAGYEELQRDALALDTMWIEGDPTKDEEADYTDEFERDVANALHGRGNSTEFPHREVIEAAIIQLLRERGGSVKIRTRHWNLYEELAERLGVSIQARERMTLSTGESAWRPEVGFARKNLEQRGVIASTLLSGRGIWQLASH